MPKDEHEHDCLYCWGDPGTQRTLVSGRILVCREQVRFKGDDLVLSWPSARIREVTYEPTHPVDIDAAAGGRVDEAQDIAVILAMDYIPEPAISIVLEDPEAIVEERFDIRLVFATEYRAKLAMKRIQAVVDPRYSSSDDAYPTMQASEPVPAWNRVDRTLRELRAQLRKARTEEQCQVVGLMCRELLVSLAQAAYDPEVHAPIDGTKPSSTDAPRMLEAYLVTELKGRSNEAARRHARAALALANDLQHRRTATIKDAALCAEATASLVNLIAILTGRHGGV